MTMTQYSLMTNEHFDCSLWIRIDTIFPHALSCTNLANKIRKKMTWEQMRAFTRSITLFVSYVYEGLFMNTCD
jgi:hypothetical protein